MDKVVLLYSHLSMNGKFSSGTKIHKQTKIFIDDVFSVIGVYYTKKGVFLYLAFQMKCKYSVETYDLA